MIIKPIRMLETREKTISGNYTLLAATWTFVNDEPNRLRTRKDSSRMCAEDKNATVNPLPLSDRRVTRVMWNGISTVFHSKIRQLWILSEIVKENEKEKRRQRVMNRNTMHKWKRLLGEQSAMVLPLDDRTAGRDRRNRRDAIASGRLWFRVSPNL